MDGRSLAGHPFVGLAPGRWRRVWWIAFVAMCAATIVLFVTSAPLFTDAAPWGIVSWQLAADAASVAVILDVWGAAGRRAAGVGLVADLVFAPAYGVVLGLGAVRLGAVLPRRPWAGVTRAASWSAVTAATADMAENLAMLAVLRSAPSDALAVLTRTLAVVKFAALAVAGVLVVAAVAAWLRGRRRR